LADFQRQRKFRYVDVVGMTNARSFGAPSRRRHLIGGHEMQSKDLPKRPGEHGPDDIGKKGGAPLDNPSIEGPTDIPDKGGDVRQPPA